MIRRKEVPPLLNEKYLNVQAKKKKKKKKKREIKNLTHTCYLSQKFLRDIICRIHYAEIVVSYHVFLDLLKSDINYEINITADFVL